MEESKEIQSLYTLFRGTIYVSLFIEFFIFAYDPSYATVFGELIVDIHRRLANMIIYQNLIYSKLVGCPVRCANFSSLF